MRDFTHWAYVRYLEALTNSIGPPLRFDEFLSPHRQAPPESFCMIRHDVDRCPRRALEMAQLEHSMGLRATYYFRAKRNSFSPQIVTAIHKMGHEIGYHYESLADAGGDFQRALVEFRENLERFRQLVPVSTISMHGRPFSRHDSRDLWRVESNHRLLAQEFQVWGEVYLDIDYSDIAYITDTGRNWSSSRANRRDKVDSHIEVDFKSGADLLNYLRQPHPKLVFQIHPERWTRAPMNWVLQWGTDTAVNFAKRCITVTARRVITET